MQVRAIVRASKAVRERSGEAPHLEIMIPLVAYEKELLLARKIVDRSPFETIDRPGVGWLVRLAAWTGREAKPDLKLGICGEHGGDPESISFFAMAGLDYVSCSPYRVPIE